MIDEPGIPDNGFFRAATAGVAEGTAAPAGRWNNGCFIKLVRTPVAAGGAMAVPVARREVGMVGRDPEGELEVRRLVGAPGVGEGDVEVIGRLGFEVERGEDKPE